MFPLTALKESPRKSQRREWPRLRPKLECLENRALLSDTVITFDDPLLVNKTLTNQYQAQGVVFTENYRAYLPVVTEAPAGQAQSGTQVASFCRHTPARSSACPGSRGHSR